jgi:hypothetical protein
MEENVPKRMRAVEKSLCLEKERPRRRSWSAGFFGFIFLAVWLYGTHPGYDLSISGRSTEVSGKMGYFGR